MKLSSDYRQSFQSIFKLALPLIVGQVGQVLVAVADNIMVGQLGTFELAAISLGIAIFSVFLSLDWG